MHRCLPIFVAAVVSPLTAQTFDWSLASPSTVPTARTAHAIAHHDATGRALLFGGSTSMPLGDTWIWDGAVGDWQQLQPAVAPPARSSHAMAYDPLRQRVVLFGGENGGGNLADTWQWDGFAWQQVATTSGPSARAGHAMAYDPVGQRVLLFSGSTDFGVTNDTWAFDGVSWTQLAPAASPSARFAHRLATDRERQRIVLFGGQSVAFGLLADTWEWNGSSWLPRFVPVQPLARREHALAYDPSGARVVLFGGGIGSGELGDTWQWDGASWSRATTVATPAARRGHAMVFSPVDNRLLFQGGANTALLAETWRSRRAAASYGTGCGTPPLGLVPDPTAPPFLGTVAKARIVQAPTLLQAIEIGFDNRFFGPFPLPLPLAGFGMPGCFLWQSGDLVGLGATPLGPDTLEFALAVPNLPSWLGQHLYLQAYGLAPGQNQLGVTTSNAIDWTISCPAPVPQSVVEDFDDDTQLDVEASAGTWANGIAHFAQIGGDGRHGAFDIALATATGEIIDGRMVYELDGDDTRIPGSQTLSGLAEQVTDGRFAFTSMRVDFDQHLRLVGTVPPVVTCAGRLEILGVVDVSGESVTDLHIGSLATGQPGGSGGVFGGAGGAGGDRCLGVGPGTGQFDGRDGEHVNVAAGHAYAASTAGTGGSGSTLYPASGLNADQQFGAPALGGLYYCLSAAAGGSGGGLWTAGGDGFVEGVFSGLTPVPNMAQFMGPTAPGGVAFQVVPYIPGVLSSLDHFLIGGAGGGGAASNATLSLNLARTWASGAGAGGGGGVVGLRAGNELLLAAGSKVLANGGSARDYVGIGAGAQVAPAGGGSGGSIVLQSGNVAQLAGAIRVDGGAGGVFDRQGGSGIGPNGGIVRIRAGAGGAGFVRFEKPVAPTVGELATMQPPAGPQNVAALTDFDLLVGMRSKFYATGSICAVQYVRYVIEATVNGAPMVFSDDPAVAAMPATLGAPIRALFQAGEVDPATGQVGMVGPWRENVGTFGGQVGIGSEGLNGFRFHLIVDRALANSVQVDRVTVVFR